MTILPQLRDQLVRTPILPKRANAAPEPGDELVYADAAPRPGDELVCADAAPILPQLRDRLLALPLPRRARRSRRARRPRRGSVVVALLAGTGLLATAGALAATGVIPIGAPVTPTHVNHDPHLGPGVTVSTTARLLPLRVPDPDGGPPWGMRTVTTSRGLVCVQVGRVVDGRLGVLGQDGTAGGDGRFHALPLTSAESGMPPCVTPDGAGHVFTSIDEAGFASGVGGFTRERRSCFAPGERPAHRPACPAADQREIAYGLLGPQAASISFVDGTTQTLSASDGGAYLFVRADATEGRPTAMGGAPAIAVFDSAIARVDYRDGTSCPPDFRKRPVCPLKGYVAPVKPRHPATLARPLQVSVGSKRVGKRHRFATLQVRFRAPVAITSARRFYALQARFPAAHARNCRQVVVFIPSNRDIRAGALVHLTGYVPPQCHGRLRASVVLADESYRPGRPTAATVGRFSRTIG